MEALKRSDYSKALLYNDLLVITKKYRPTTSSITPEEVAAKLVKILDILFTEED